MSSPLLSFVPLSSLILPSTDTCIFYRLCVSNLAPLSPFHSPITPCAQTASSIFQTAVRFLNLSAFMCFPDKAPGERGKYVRGGNGNVREVPYLTWFDTRINTHYYTQLNRKCELNLPHNSRSQWTYCHIAEERGQCGVDTLCGPEIGFILPMYVLCLCGKEGESVKREKKIDAA